jgi:alpha-L-fucosidase 2
MARILEWRFPLPRTHTGILQGNALLGVMIWGEGSVLRVTLGRADLWDHRGGMPWSTKQNYRDIRAGLEANDEPALRKLFETATEHTPGQPPRPSIVPVGRLEFDFGTGAELETGELDVHDGTVRVHVRRGKKKETVVFVLDMSSPLLHVTIPKPLDTAVVRRMTACETLGGELQKISFPEPVLFEDERLAGWTQEFPVDPAVCVGFTVEKGSLWIGVERGEDAAAAKQATAALIERKSKKGAQKFAGDTRAWWKRYWKDVPAVCVPNDTIQFIYDYGMYKFAGLCQPGGVPAGLQGPWIEEFQMPPWSADYHFNINVQMCYWPAYRGNRLSHLGPLFDLVWSWRETLRENARLFIGIDDGYMLPHAVDDRCMCMGSFWTGTVDHGCTAWVADMMYTYYRHSMDESFLREKAYPFMVGAMRVYEEMLEEDGGAFVLPVSVSPEYRGDAMNAWGKNASFQLACIHRLCEDLLDAAAVLGEEARASWKDILARLPKATLVDDGGYPRLGLWEGTGLEESHRHHSHLAAIAPFDTIDIDAPEWRDVVQHTHNQWVARGMGMWSGWCMSWASMLHTRLGNPHMAELILEIWDRVFTNEGSGTLHDCNFPGFTQMGSGPLGSFGHAYERMQMDAGMGCVTAVQEMLLHQRRGVHYLFRGAPPRWREVSFGPMRTDGAFLVSAERVAGTVKAVRITGEAGGTFRMANPWGGPAKLKRAGGKAETVDGGVLEIATKRGETVTVVQG